MRARNLRQKESKEPEEDNSAEATMQQLKDQELDQKTSKVQKSNLRNIKYSF